MKKTLSIILFIALCAVLLCGCNTGLKEPPEFGFLVADQFTDYKLGNVKELVPEKTITDSIIDPILVNFPSADKGLEALREKQIHGMVLPAVYANHTMETSEDFLKLHTTFIEKQLRAVSMISSERIMIANAAITKIQNNGTAKKIAMEHWGIGNPDDPYTRPSDYEKAEGRVLTIGICSDENFPYNYRADDGSLVGINVDVAYEIAAGSYADLVIKEYSEDELLPALEHGEVDLVMSQFVEDEKKPMDSQYLCTHPYCDASTYILLRSPLLDVTEKK
ncbi:MAG: transporter substrate-binding domain-containing protein [Oscillospiraceae bacterium]|nr:transporter substrate-binding domain-containing protein [Oscillospiraceae bacterium]